MHRLSEWVKFAIAKKEKIGKIIDIIYGGDGRIIVYTVQSGKEVYTISPEDIKIKKQKNSYQYATSIFYC
jgi:hypothetical protein